MRVLVTGADGFVGSRLCARLAADGQHVIPADRAVDVTDAPALSAAIAAARPDAVVHLAARSFVPDSLREPEAVFRANYLGTRNVLEALARHAPGSRLLLASSGQVYGAALPETPPHDESAPLRPATPYAWTKAAGDLLGAAWTTRGLCVVRARPFNHTGPGRPDRFVESSLARQIVERELGRATGPLAVGNLDSVRDYLDVDDVIEAYRRLLAPEIPAAAYNIASGVGRRIGDVLDALLARTTRAIEVKSDPSRWRAADANVGSAARLRDLTGWAPRIAFEDTLDALLDDWRVRLRAA